MRSKSIPGPTIFSKVFNELPVPTVVFFRAPRTKPMANFAARQLFGVQLGALTKNLLCAATGGAVRKCVVKDLPWRVALSRGMGARQEKLLLPDAKIGEYRMLRVFAMPIRDGKEVIAAVATFEEIQA